MSEADFVVLAEALERIEARLERIDAKLATVERSGRNMDAHIAMVERMLQPFQALLRLRS